MCSLQRHRDSPGVLLRLLRLRLQKWRFGLCVDICVERVAESPGGTVRLRGGQDLRRCALSTARGGISMSSRPVQLRARRIPPVFVGFGFLGGLKLSGVRVRDGTSATAATVDLGLIFPPHRSKCLRLALRAGRGRRRGTRRECRVLDGDCAAADEGGGEGGFEATVLCSEPILSSG
jgi:hypothetical protein